MRPIHTLKETQELDKKLLTPTGEGELKRGSVLSSGSNRAQFLNRRAGF